MPTSDPGDVLVFTPPAPESLTGSVMVELGLGEICGWLRDNGFGFDQRSLFVECRYLNQHRFRRDQVDLEPFEIERLKSYLKGGEDIELEETVSELVRMLDLHSYDTVIVPAGSNRIFPARDISLMAALPILERVQDEQLVIVAGADMIDEMDVARYRSVDYAVDGSFEMPLSNIFAHEFGGEELEVEPGVRVERDGEVFRGEPYRHPMEMKPRPYFHAELLEKAADVNVLDSPIVPYHIGRGCSQDCSFCNLFEDQRFEYKSVDKVVQELRQLKRETGADNFWFTDQNIFNDPEYVEELADRLQQEKLDVSWGSLAVILPRDQEFFDNLAASGCKTLHHGIESASDSVLHRMRKHQTRDMIESTLEKERKAGIEPFAYLIVDYVDESIGEYYETVEFVRENDHLVGAQVSPLGVFADDRNPIYRDPEEFGVEIKEQEFDHWTDYSADFTVPFTDSSDESWEQRKSRGERKQRYLQKLADFELLFKNFGRRHPLTLLKMQLRKLYQKNYPDFSHVYS